MIKKNLNPKEKYKVGILKTKRDNLEKKREELVNKYIIPIEIKLEKIRNQIDEVEIVD